MKPSDWFVDQPVIGKLAPEQVAAKLREVGDAEVAHTIEVSSAKRLRGSPMEYNKNWWPFQDKPWQHTSHAFGFIAPQLPSSDSIPILHAGNISPDKTLRNARIKITLDRMHVAQYPGRGTHYILFDFYAQNQVVGGVEHLHFNASYKARQGEQAAILGYPIFVGLGTSNEGVAFKCYTVNVKNEQDEAFLGFLESDVFKSGLKLASAVQPAIAPLSGMAFAITKSIASRHRNVPVQEFYLGLDFSSVPTRARLSQGSYIAVQIPESDQKIWDWRFWVYDTASGQVVSKDQNSPMNLNYLIFSVSKFEESV